MILKIVIGVLVAGVMLGACSATEPFETPSPTPDDVILEGNSTLEGDVGGEETLPSDEAEMGASPSPANGDATMLETETETAL
jgi:hypothetical protein